VTGPGKHLALVALLGAAAVAPAAAQEPRVLSPGASPSDQFTGQEPVTRSRRAPYHIWTFEGRRGQRVVLDMMSRDFDAYLVLRDPDGAMVAYDDDSGEGNDARIRTVLPRDGRYRLVATAFSAEARGRYSLSLSSWDTAAGPPPGAVAELRPGDTREGVLEPGDSIGADGPYEDRWMFDARAGARLRLELRADDMDAYLIVLGPDGRMLASDDDGLGDRNSVVMLRAAAAGRYTAIASSFGESPVVGTYRITLIDDAGSYADPGVAAALAPGQTLEGRLEEGDDQGERGFQDDWTFAGRAGQAVRLDVMSREFDPYVVLMRDGVPVDSNDDGGDGTDARLTITLPATGAYTAVVSPFSRSNRGGRYTIALAMGAAPAGPGQTTRLAVGQPVFGRLESGDRPREGGGYEDWFEFEGRAGQQVSIEMRADFDAYLELRDPRGVILAEDDDGLGDGTDAHILTALPANGRFRVVARAFGETARTGLYELRLSLAAAPAAAGRPGEIRPGETLVGRLEAGDSLLGDSTYADSYTFRPDRSGEVVIDLMSSDFDAYLLVRDAEGRTLGSDDDGGSGRNSRLRMRVTAGQTYRILANSYGEERSTGSYRLSLRWSP
jgi:hypothetical protein